jgi:hypothetical protein
MPGGTQQQRVQLGETSLATDALGAQVSKPALGLGVGHARHRRRAAGARNVPA